MSKRLQVLLDDEEMRDLRRIARRRRTTVAEWVRQALRLARNEQSAADPSRKLAALREASRCEFPTGPVETMLADIERGYARGDPSS